MTTTLAGLFEHARLPDTDPVHARNAVAFALTIPGQLPYQGYVDVAAPGLYWIEQGRGERVLKLSPDQPGVTLHALVFEGAPE